MQITGQRELPFHFLLGAGTYRIVGKTEKIFDAMSYLVFLKSLCITLPQALKRYGYDFPVCWHFTALKLMSRKR